MGNALYKACNLVCEAIGAPISKGNLQPETVEQVCQPSGLHYRPVALTDGWWESHEGHFLGFLKDGQAVAILQKGPAQFEIVDPITNTRTPITKDTAQTLVPRALTFYPPFPEDSDTLWKFLRFGLRRTRHDYLSIAFAGILAAVIGLFFPIATKLLFDRVIPEYNLTLLTQVLIGLSIAGFSMVALSFTRAFFVMRIDGLLMNRLQIGLWDRLLKLPVSFFRKVASGDLVLQTFVFEQMRRTFNQGALQVLLNGIFSVVYFGIMVYFSWTLSLIALGMALLGVAVTVFIMFMVQKVQRKLLASNAKIYGFLTQVISGISKLRIAAAEQKVFDKWSEDYEENLNLSYKIATLSTQSAALNSLLQALSQIFIIGTIIGMFTLTQGQLPMSIGTFLAFNAAYLPFTSAIFGAAGVMISLITLIPFWERARPIFITPIEQSKGKADPGTLQGNIEISDLSFRYDEGEPLVLDDISLKIEPGEFIGLIGPSGSGKSTLCRLLIGFEIADSGSILFDGKDLSTLDPYRVRAQIGTLLQGTSIFAGSLYDNLVCGGKYPPEQLMSSIKLTTFDEDLAQLPMGLDTILPPGGGTLSGGQRQRLLLTRAVLRQPKILILDEATSMLDNQTQEHVAKNLETLEATRIVVAHRLSTIRNADRIYVLDQGKIVATGTYDALSESCELFRHFLERQKM